MPLVSVIAIRASLCFLCLGAALGFGIALARVAGSPLLPLLLRAHWPLMLLGWLLQFSLAVAYWMFPKFGVERPRGALVGLGLALLGAGSVGVALGGSAPAWSAVMAGTFLAFLAIARRIKPHAGRP